MPDRYRELSCNAKENAQSNLKGRTPYCEDGTLKFHKSKVIHSRHFADGLLLGIITSDALDYENTRRGFRFSIFDIFGNVVDRTPLEGAFRTSTQAGAAMREALARIDAAALTGAAIDRVERIHAEELAELRGSLRP